MTATIRTPGEQMLGTIADGINLAAALATQQQLAISDPGGQLAVSTGVLGQYPPAAGSPGNYTYGWGLEVLSGGSGSAPVLRAGIIEWTSQSGGTRTIIGLVQCDSGGLVRAVFDDTGLNTYTTTGAAASTIYSI